MLTSDMTQTEPARATGPAAYPGTPRWVKLSGIVVLLIVLVFGGLHLVGRGLGPGSHLAPARGH